MPTHCIDYFATIGIKDGFLKAEGVDVVEDDIKSQLDVRYVWDEAITDIAVIMEEESAPDDTWEVLKKTLNGLDLFPPHVAIRRRKHSGKIDHISEVQLVLEGAVIPTGFTLLTSSITNKFSAYLNPIGFLAYKKTPDNYTQLIKGQCSIDSISIVLSSEKDNLPDNYQFMKTVWRIGQPEPEFGVSIAYRSRAPVGLGNIAYKCSTVDRYPRQDNKGTELPSNELPLFGFPHGLRLHYGSQQRYPLPQLFTFVFTNVVGEHFYAVCLRFFEKIPLNDMEEVIKSIYGFKIDQSGDSKTVYFPEGDSFFCPKVIAVISKKPFYRAMRRLLRQIYSLSLSSSPCPIEHYIVSLVNTVPLPIPGGRSFHFVFDAAMISSTSKSLAPITFAMPNERFFPLTDLDFAGPLRCLSIDIFLSVFTLMLQEAKIVFLCRSNVLLTETMETLRALLFPLTWSACFVSPLPDALSGLLEAPGGFMIGFHVSEELTTDNEESDISKRLAKGESLLHQQNWTQSLVPDTFIVDLSSNKIYKRVNREREELLSHNDINDILKTMPFGPRKRLTTALTNIAENYEIGPQFDNSFEEYDSAFDFQARDVENIKNTTKFPTLEIRDAFLVFMIDLLGDYTMYIRPPSRNIKENMFRTFKESFFIEEYISHSDPSMKCITELLLETQMFSVLLQQRAEGKTPSLAFFEDAANLYRELGFSAGGHGDKINSLTGHPIPDIPVPMYRLLACHEVYERRYGTYTEEIPSSSLFMSTSSVPTNVMPISNSRHYSRGPSLSSSHSPTSMSFSRPSLLNEASLRKQPQVKVRREYLTVLIEFYKNSFDRFGTIFDWFDYRSYTDINISDSTTARNELDKGFDLELNNPSLGPLVIPGPLKNDVVKGDISSGYDDVEQYEEIEPSTRFTYQESWPTLNEKYLIQAQSILHPRLKYLRKARAFTQDKVKASIATSIRTSAERAALDTLLPESYRPYAAGQNQSPPRTTGSSSQAIDVKHIYGIILDLASVSLTMLAARTIHSSKPTNDLLQMLGIMAQLEGAGLIHLFEECVWRAALVACSEYKGDFAKKISCTLFDSAALQHKSPDALTYGQFIQTLSATTNLSNDESNLQLNESAISDQLDVFSFLEDMGSSWFFDQRISQLSSQFDQAQQQLISKNSRSSGSITSSFSFSDLVSQKSDSVQVSSKYMKQYISLDTAKIIAEQNLLSKNPTSLISLYRPNDMVHALLPKHASEFQINNYDGNEVISSALNSIKTRTKEMKNEILASTDRVVNTDLSPSVSRKSRDSTSGTSPVSTRSPVASSAQTFSRMFAGGLKLGMDGTSNLMTSAAQAALGTNKQSDKTSSSSWLPSTRWLSGSSSNLNTITPPKQELPKLPERTSATSTKRRARRLTSDGFSDDESCGSDDLEGEVLNLSDDLKFDVELEKLDHEKSASTDHAPVVKDSDIPLATMKSASMKTDSPDAILRTRQSITNSNLISSIQKIYLKEYQHQGLNGGQGIGIHSQMNCLSCGFAMLDEEILAASYGYSVDHNTRKTRRQSLRPFQQISCLSCHQLIIPKLNITCYRSISPKSSEITVQPHEQDNGVEVQGDIQILSKYASQVVVEWEEEVEYYNPTGMRRAMEDALKQIGSNVVNSKFLHRYFPELFWNLIWYTQRSSLPNGFLPLLQTLAIDDEIEIAESFWSEIDVRRKERYSSRLSLSAKHSHMKWLHGPIAVSWKEHIARAKIGRAFSNDNIPHHDIDLEDLFPGCSSSEKAKFIAIANNLDDLSWTGMREALIDLTTITRNNPSLRDQFKSGTESFARYLYIALTQIAVVTKKDKILHPHISEFSTDLPKGSLLDKCYADTIKSFMLHEDFEMMGVSSEAMLAGIPSESSRLFRMTLSLLL